MARLPPAVHAIARAISDVQTSPDWAAAVGDRDVRTWLATRAVCEALCRAGVMRGVPDARALEALLEHAGRDRAIVSDFNGRNHAALARRHRLSTRQVRRIIAASAGPRDDRSS